MDERDRASLLSGLWAVVQEGRKNINGSKPDITFRMTVDCVTRSCQKVFGMATVESRHSRRKSFPTSRAMPYSEYFFVKKFYDLAVLISTIQRRHGLVTHVPERVVRQIIHGLIIELSRLISLYVINYIEVVSS